jgi:hypothetical protein
MAAISSQGSPGLNGRSFDVFCVRLFFEKERVMILSPVARLQKDLEATIGFNDAKYLFSVDSPQKGLRNLKFTKLEWRLFKRLVLSYPDPVLYEELYASYFSQSVAESRLKLQKAKQQKSGELKPLRDTLYRMKPKLQEFHLIIIASRDEGYCLAYHRKEEAQPLELAYL